MFLLSCLGLLLVGLLTGSASSPVPEIVRKVKPSIVVIDIYDNRHKHVGLGTGFFVNDDINDFLTEAYIGDVVVTNHHIVAAGRFYVATTMDGKKLPEISTVFEDDPGS